MKRNIALFLVILQLLTLSSSFSFSDYNYLYSLDIYNKSKEQLQQKVNGQYVISDQDIFDYIVQVGGQQPQNWQNNLLNPNTYRNYKVIAYGDPFGDKYESFKVDPNFKTKEYRYLGFDYYGNKISNDQFANDFEISSVPTSRNYVAKNFTKQWEEDINPDTAQSNRLLYSNVLNDDKRENEYYLTNYSVATLLGAKIGEYKSYVELMAEPTYLQEGVFRLWHKGKKGVYYDTMRTVKMDNLTVLTNMAVDKPSITLEPTATGVVNANITVNSNMMFTDRLGQSETKYLKTITQVVESSFREFSGEENIFKNENLIINRALNSNEKTRTYTVPIDVNCVSQGQSKTFEFKAKTIVKTAYNNSFISNTATVSIVVSKGTSKTSTSADVDFRIFINGVDYTDSKYKVADLNFTTPINVTLKDVSFMSGINSEFYYWYVAHTGALLKAGDTSAKDFTFEINSSNKGTFVDSNSEISFNLKVMDNLGEFHDSPTHKTTFLVNPPAPPIVNPLADLFARTKDISFGYNSVDVYAGEVVKLDGSKSYSPDKNITIDQYNINTSGFTQKASTKSTRTGYFDKPGTYTQTINVVDSNGTTSTNNVQLSVHVLDPKFNLKIGYGGTLKENRKVTFDIKSSDLPAYYPLDMSSLRWEIAPLDGGSSLNDGLVGKDSFNAQFSKKGRYKVKVTGTIKSLDTSNTKTYTKSAEIIVDVVEDEKPVVEFAVNKFKIRDPKLGNGILVSIIDKSYSTDGDRLGNGVLKYRYDSNDNGIFDDDADVVVTTSFSGYYEFVINANVVGKFKFYVDHTEIPMQEYLHWEAAYNKTSSSEQYMREEDKIMEVLNVAPSVVYDVESLKTVTYVIATDFTGERLLQLQSQMEKLKAQLLSKKVNPNFVYFSTKKSFGVREVNKYRYTQQATIKYTYLSHSGSWVTREDVIDYNNYPGEYWATQTPVLPSLSGASGTAQCNGDYNVENGGGSVTRYYWWNIPLSNGTTYRYDVSAGMYSDRGGALSSNYSEARMTVNNYYTPIVVGSTQQEILSLDYGALKGTLESISGEKMLLMYSDNQYFTGDLRESFVNYAKDSGIQIVSNITNMSNPFEVSEVEDFYSTDIYGYTSDIKSYIKLKNGKVLRIDHNNNVVSQISNFDEGRNPNSYNWYILQLNNIAGYSLKNSDDKYFSMSDLSKSLMTQLSYKSETDIFGNPLGVKDYWMNGQNYNMFKNFSNNLSSFRNVPYLLNGEIKMREQLISMDSNVSPRLSDKYVTFETGVSELIGINVRQSGMSNNAIDYEYRIYYKKNGVNYLGIYNYTFDLYNGSRFDPTRNKYEGVTGSRVMTLGISPTKIDKRFIIDQNAKVIYSLDGVPLFGYRSIENNVLEAHDGSFHIMIEDNIYPIHNKNVYYDGLYYRYFHDNKSYIYDSYAKAFYSLSLNGGATCIKFLNGVAFGSDNTLLQTYVPINYWVYGTRYTFNEPYSVTYAKASGKSYIVRTPNLLITERAVIERSVVNVTADMRRYSDLFKINRENKIISDLNLLADTLNGMIEIPYYDGKTAVLLLGDSFETAMMYCDYEGDPIKKMNFDFIHDPNVFQNPLGYDPSSGKGLQNPITTFNYTGLYRGTMNVWDKPNLDSYSEKNQVDTTINIYVHRRPIAKPRFGYELSGSNMFIRCYDNGSFDYDHQGDPDKGVVAYFWELKNVDTGQTYTAWARDHSFYVPIGNYQISLKVWDKENVTSRPAYLDFDLNSKLINLSGGLPKYSYKLSENISVQDIYTTSFNSNPNMINVQVLDGATPIVNYNIWDAQVPFYKKWADTTFQLPQDRNLGGKKLKLRLQAYDGALTSNVVEQEFTVEQSIFLEAKVLKDEVEIENIGFIHDIYTTSLDSNPLYVKVDYYLGSNIIWSDTVNTTDNGSRRHFGGWYDGFGLGSPIWIPLRPDWIGESVNAIIQAFDGTVASNKVIKSFTLIGKRQLTLTGALDKTSVRIGESFNLTDLISTAKNVSPVGVFVHTVKDGAIMNTRYINTKEDLSSQKAIWGDGLMSTGNRNTIFTIPNDESYAAKTIYLVMQAYDSAWYTSNVVTLSIDVQANNQPPTVSFVGQSPATIYEGGDLTNIVTLSDPDKDNLSLSYYVAKPGGSYVLYKQYSNVAAGSTLNLQPVTNMDQGTYSFKVVVSDGKASAEATKTVYVNPLSISASLLPLDPMAGDKLYFNISTTGYADKVEIILESDIVNNDKRVEMGYKGVTYEGNKIVVPIANPTLNNTFTHQYIVWCTTPQSLTLKNVRKRSPYTFVIKAYRGDKVSNEVKIVREIQGDVRQLLKITIKK